MDTNKGTKILLLSYLPLLNYTKAGYQPGQTSLDGLEAIIAETDDVENHATACLWCQWSERANEGKQAYGGRKLACPPGTYFPILILPRAQEIADHLRTWAEDKPEDWFDVLIDSTHDRGPDFPPDNYAIVLIPRAQRSFDRWRTGYLMTHGTFTPTDWDFQIVCQPLAFGSGHSRLYNTIKSRLPGIGSSLPVGLLDQDVFLKYQDNIDTLPDEAILLLGMIQRGDHNLYRDWLDPFLKDLTRPPKGEHWISPHFST